MTLDVYSGLFTTTSAPWPTVWTPPQGRPRRNVWARCGRGHRPARRLTANALFRVVGPVGIEPATCGSEGRRRPFIEIHRRPFALVTSLWLQSRTPVASTNAARWTTLAPSTARRDLHPITFRYCPVALSIDTAAPSGAWTPDRALIPTLPKGQETRA